MKSNLIDVSALTLNFITATGADFAIAPLVERALTTDNKLAREVRGVLKEVDAAQKAAGVLAEIPKATQQPVFRIICDKDGTLLPDTANLFTGSRGIDVMEMVAGYKAKDKRGYAPAVSFPSVVVEKSQARLEGQRFTESNMRDFAATLEGYPGAEQFVGLWKDYFKTSEPAYRFESIIISTGLHPIVENTRVAQTFDHVWATTLELNEKGEISGLRRGIGPVEKAGYLFQILKGIGEKEYAADPMAVVQLRDGLNPKEAKRQLLRAASLAIYIGDGPTDRPAYEAMHALGGKAIQVYKIGDEKKQKAAEEDLQKGWIDAIAPADYRPGSELNAKIEKLVRPMIDADRAGALKKAAEKLPALAFELKSSDLMRRANSIGKKLTGWAEQAAASGRKVEVLAH